MRAQLIKKGKVSKGLYEENEQNYGNQIYWFKEEGGMEIHANVNDKHGNVSRYSPLRTGDWIENYRMLPSKPNVIDPKCTFNIIPEKTRGGTALF